MQERIPILVGGRSAAAIRRAAAVGDGWMPYLMAPERIAAGVEEITALGTPPPRVVAHVFVKFGDDRAAARRAAVAILSDQYGQNMERVVDRSVGFGPAADVAAHLDRYAAAGATDVVLRILEPDDFLATLERDVSTVKVRLEHHAPRPASPPNGQAVSRPRSASSSASVRPPDWR